MLPRDQASPFDSAKTTGCGQKNQLRRGGNVLKIASFSLPVALGAALVILFLIALTFSDLPGTYAYLTAQDQLGAAVFTVAIPPVTDILVPVSIVPAETKRRDPTPDFVATLTLPAGHGHGAGDIVLSTVKFVYQGNFVTAQSAGISGNVFTATFPRQAVLNLLPNGNRTVTVEWTVAYKRYYGSQQVKVNP